MAKTPKFEPKRYPEIPVNLPANAAGAEYGSDAIAELISAMGFEHVFLLPGSSYRGLHDSLVNHTRNTRPEMVLCASELIAISAAHGYAKATGKPALCIVHDLVGLMLGCMSVFNAWCDQVPVVVLGGAGPLDPNQRRFIDWMHSANAQADLVKTFAKWTAEPPTLQATLDAILRAHRVAGTRPYGPVYVSIDQGVQEAPIPEGLVMPDPAAPQYRPPAPMAADAEAIERAAAMLVEANMPLIVGGRIGYHPAATQPLTALVEAAGAAYLDDRNVACLATDHAQNMSGEDGFRTTADAVLAVDCIEATLAVAGYGGAERGRTGQRVIDMSMNFLVPNSWSNYGGPLPAIELQIPCDPITGMRQLTEAIAVRLAADPKRAEAVAARRAALKARHDALRAHQRDGWRGDADVQPIHRARLTEALGGALAGKPWRLVMRNNRGLDEGILRLEGAGHYLGDGGGGGVGYGPGGAVGAALALKGTGRLPVAIMGDGEFVIASGAMWTAAHYRVPLLLVITNNTSWGNDEHHQLTVARTRGRPLENAWIGQRMNDPDIDFASLARSYGAWAEGPVTEPKTLDEVFRRAVAAVEAGQPAVVDVRVGL